MRRCTHCHKPLTPEELAREETTGMEAERRALRLEGVRFRFYTCSGCGYADIFVDLVPVDGETAEAFQQRRRELEATVRQLHAERVEVVLTQK